MVLAWCLYRRGGEKTCRPQKVSNREGHIWELEENIILREAPEYVFLGATMEFHNIPESKAPWTRLDFGGVVRVWDLTYSQAMVRLDI